MRRVAIGAWPSPRESWWKRSEMPHCWASSTSCLAGSTPDESTKMMGDSGVDASNTAPMSCVGGSTKRDPRLLTTKLRAANTTRSGRRDRRTSMRCISSHLFSHSIGSAAASGSGFWNQSAQSRPLCSNELAMPLNAASFSSSVTLSHAASDSQARQGLSCCWSRSSTCPPLRKNSYSSRLSFPAPARIFAHIWNEKSSLCCSNRPRHVPRYTANVWYSLMLEIRSFRSFDDSDLSMLMLNAVMYDSSENWYIGSTLAMSLSTKKRIEARCAHGRYPSRATSIFTSVCSLMTIFSFTSSDVDFADCSVSTSFSSSKSEPCAVLSRLRISSSSSARRFCPAAIPITSSSFCSSSSGFSLRTTIPRSWSSRPRSFTAKLTIVVFVEISGV
eukprot:Opistho-2@89674